MKKRKVTEKAKKKKVAAPKQVNGILTTIDSFARSSMVAYGTHVNLERSVPDLYDGLKPVQRRIMYAALHQSRGTFVKSARIVGDTIGKYHPHGDSAVYDAMVKMVHIPEPLVDGSGNWGSLVDNAAAYRYTNATLTPYGYSFFDKHYFNKHVTDFVENFDGMEVEPVVLPAALPNVLVNGDSGIGWGVTCNIPAFTPRSLIRMMTRILKKEKLKAIDFAKTLKPNLANGGRIVNSKENKKQYVKLFTGSEAKIKYEAVLQVDEERRSIFIDNWPPGLKPETLLKKLLKNPRLLSFSNTSGTTGYTAVMKKGYNLDQFSEFVTAVQRATQTSESYKINVTHRKAHVDDGVTRYTVDFLSMSVAQLLMFWLKRRLELETISLKHRIDLQEKAVAYSELLLYATDILDVIFAALRKDNSAEYISKKSKLSVDEAKQILELRVRQLSKLDATELKKKLKDQKAHLVQLNKWLKKPRLKLIQDFAELEELFSKKRK